MLADDGTGGLPAAPTFPARNQPGVEAIFGDPFIDLTVSVDDVGLTTDCPYAPKNIGRIVVAGARHGVHEPPHSFWLLPVAHRGVACEMKNRLDCAGGARCGTTTARVGCSRSSGNPRIGCLAASC